MFSGKLNIKTTLIIIFSLKWIVSGFFTSDYSIELFIPFTNQFLDHGWDAWKVSELNFPYPPLMAIILAPFVKVADFFNSIIVANLLLHIPLLLADIGICSYLLKLRPKSPSLVIAYYALSPIIFYASYMHGQLDLLPTFFLFASSFYLIKGKWTKSFLLMGLSIAIKWHTAAAIPFFFIYLFKKEGLNRRHLNYALICLIPLSLTLLPFGSIRTAVDLFNVSEGGFVFETFIHIMDLEILLFPLVYIGLAAFAFSYPRMNADLFLGLMAIVFMAFVMVVYPNPGWFVWSIPFINYGFIREEQKKRTVFLLYGLICASYLTFFLLFYKHPLNEFSDLRFLGKNLDLTLQTPDLKQVSFTALVAFMSLGIIVIYRTTIKRSPLYKRKFQAFVIGIAGNSGAGKTRLLRSLQKIMGDNLFASLEGDADHRWQRGDASWKNFTHLNPKANKLYRQLLHLQRLKKGLPAFRSNYNHKTGSFEGEVQVRPKDFVALAGLHPFYLKKAREIIDFKIYLDTEEQLRRHWKVLRDRKERGHETADILKQIDERAEDSQKYILPQKEHADFIIRYQSSKELKIGKTELADDEISILYKLDIDVQMEPILTRLEKERVKIHSHDFSKNLIQQSIVASAPADFNPARLSDLFKDFFSTFNITDFKWETGLSGLNQVIVLYAILAEYTGGNLEEF